MLIVNSPDSTFVQTLDGEGELGWCRAIDVIIDRLYGTRPNWLRYECGPVVTWRGRDYRSFRCVAGSVTGFMMVAASKAEIGRAFMIIGKDRGGHPSARHWFAGREEQFDPRPILLQLRSDGKSHEE